MRLHSHDGLNLSDPADVSHLAQQFANREGACISDVMPEHLGLIPWPAPEDCAPTCLTRDQIAAALEMVRTTLPLSWTVDINVCCDEGWEVWLDLDGPVGMGLPTYLISPDDDECTRIKVVERGVVRWTPRKGKMLIGFDEDWERVGGSTVATIEEAIELVREEVMRYLSGWGVVPQPAATSQAA